MRISQIRATDVSGTLRFDSRFHISRQNPLLTKLRSGKWPMEIIGEVFGPKNVWSGNIFARVYASSKEHGKPLLVPYDLFRYIPWSDKILSRTQVRQFDRLAIKRGWLFIVCSGRNLGPATIADRFCERFTMSHDMVRIAVPLSDELFYLTAFLSTAHGQALIRTDMNGSVIDHTDERQIAAIAYPRVRTDLMKRCAASFRNGFQKRERGRLLLAETHAAFLRLFGLEERRMTTKDYSRRFHIHRSQIGSRFDAERFAPIYSTWRRLIAEGGGCRLDEIAEVTKPYGRNRTIYVQGPEHGRPMMNGRQIAQYKAIGLQYMSPKSMANWDAFQVHAGMTLLTADGRAEENLADCVLLTEDRSGWAASGHVHRVKPREGVDPGLVYLACSCAPVQACLKSLATGSVVDGLSESDVKSVIVPYSTSNAALRLGKAASKAWALFSEANEAEAEATIALEEEFRAP